MSSDGAVPILLGPSSMSQCPCGLSNSAGMDYMFLCLCSLSLLHCPCMSLLPSSVSSTLTPSAEAQDDLQRILSTDEDCSSSGESYIGKSNGIASSSSDEDHPVVFAPLGVGDPFAGLPREVGCHFAASACEPAEAIGGRSPIDDSRMDPLVQAALKSRWQRRKHTSILRARVHEPRNANAEPNHQCAEVRGAEDCSGILPKPQPPVNWSTLRGRQCLHDVHMSHLIDYLVDRPARARSPIHPLGLKVGGRVHKLLSRGSPTERMSSDREC